MNALKIVLVSLVFAGVILLAGCGGVLPGFRFAPGEPQKEVAQVGADLATVAATTGLPPTSEAAKQMAQSARAGSLYTGPPKTPVDVSALLPPVVLNAWNIMERRVEAFRLKRDVLDRTAEITSEGLANLAADIEGQANVDADRVVFRAAAIVEGQKMGAELADAIALPLVGSLSPAEAERLRRLDKALSKVQATAATQAARRPTTEEVVDAVEDQVLNTADKIFGMLEDYGVMGLLAGTGVGGVALAIRKRKQAKQATEDAKFAKVREAGAREASERAVEEARLEAAKVAKLALEMAAANGKTDTPSA